MHLRLLEVNRDIWEILLILWKEIKELEDWRGNVLFKYQRKVCLHFHSLGMVKLHTRFN